MRNLLVGDKIKLTPIREVDLPIIEGWFEDVEFLRHYDKVAAIPIGGKALKDGLESFNNTNERFIFAIRDKETGNIIGVIGFDDIMWNNAVAKFYIGIGDVSYRGKGIGKEAIRLILDFGFNELNLYRIHLDVIEYNTSAIRLYEGAGFVKEGVYRELIYRDGKRYNLYLYGLLRSEWK